MIKDSTGAAATIAGLAALIYGANQEALAGVKGGSAVSEYLPQEEKSMVDRDPKRRRHVTHRKGRRR